MQDHFTESGARRLAGRIEHFWRQQGRAVTCYVERIYNPKAKSADTVELWVVRSDMKNGAPA
jgi:hypothetical protein